MLQELVLSVKAQTFRDFEHLVYTDVEKEGCATACNRAVQEARGEWVFLIADDDLMLPACLQHHIEASEHADVVYAPPLVWGEDPAQFLGEPPGIPSTALIRRELWLARGGYDNALDQTEDRDLWERLLGCGARFVRVGGHPTWVYRLGHNNKSRGWTP